MSGGTYWNPETQRWEDGGGPPSYDTGGGRGKGLGDGRRGGSAGRGGQPGPPHPAVPPPPPVPPSFPPPSAAPGAGGDGAAESASGPGTRSGPGTGSGPGAASGPDGGSGPGGGDTTAHGPAGPDTGPGTRTGEAAGDTVFDGLEDPPRRRRRPLGTVLVASVLAAAAVAAALWFTVGPGGDGDTERSAAPSVSDSSDSSDGTDGSDNGDATDGTGEESAEPSASASPEVPDGYEVVTDATGFTIAVPVGWSRTSEGSSIFYLSPDRRSLIQFFAITEPGYTPVTAVRETDKGLEKALTDYLSHGHGPVDSGPENPSGDAAELLYRYTSALAGGPRQCIERAFTATDGKLVALLACAPDAQSPAQRTLLDNALAHFTP
ncbi:hypothetical protein ACWDR0_13710 [Streptomyces sp. NPDC003691]